MKFVENFYLLSQIPYFLNAESKFGLSFSLHLNLMVHIKTVLHDSRVDAISISLPQILLRFIMDVKLDQSEFLMVMGQLC